MQIHFLPPNTPFDFPPTDLATPDGILAVGGNLQVNTLLKAYQRGIFPWFNENEPIIWWAPDPRMVLFPQDLKIAKSMRPYFNQQKFSVTYNQQFRQVIEACAQARGLTWITKDIIAAYCRLHQNGYATSVEVWKADELVGGLYGVRLGKVFFGESMFAVESNASKFGFISLVQKLKEESFLLIDCQQETSHLKSLGATLIPRLAFEKILIENEKWIPYL